MRDEHRTALANRAPERFELHLYETVALRDGRHANNPWLQELPDPITKLTWGHGLAVAPAAAERLGVRDGDVVAVSGGAVRVELPVCMQPGQSPGTVSIALGYGRTRAGKVGGSVGVNAYPLMQRAARWDRARVRDRRQRSRRPDDVRPWLRRRPIIRWKGVRSFAR